MTKLIVWRAVRAQNISPSNYSALTTEANANQVHVLRHVLFMDTVFFN